MAELLSSQRVTIDNVDTLFKSGWYAHGDKVFNGGSYGVLIVFHVKSYNYTIHIDVNMNGVFWRLSTGELCADWSEWEQL